MSTKDPSTNASNDSMSGLEGRLANTLQPVKPSRAYVRSLRDRIRPASTPVIIQRATDYNFWLVVMGSAVTALVVIVTVGRALYYLFGRSRG